jgi:hypothetical protein
MPDYEVVVRYKIEWTGTKSIKAKDEETAERRVTEQLGKVVDFATFKKYINGDINEEVNECDVEEVNEA